MFTFALLVNSASLDRILKVLKYSYILFCSSHVDDQIEAACNSLEEMFQTLGQTDNYENETEDEDDITEIEDIHSVTKPFLSYIQQKLKIFHTCQSSSTSNLLYQQKWKDILEKKWLPFIPIWTSILRGKIHYTSNQFEELVGDINRYKNWSQIHKNETKIQESVNKL